MAPSSKPTSTSPPPPPPSQDRPTGSEPAPGSISSLPTVVLSPGIHLPDIAEIQAHWVLPPVSAQAFDSVTTGMGSSSVESATSETGQTAQGTNTLDSSAAEHDDQFWDSSDDETEDEESPSP